MRILAVDDDATNRAWVQAVLGEAGYHIDVAVTAAEGKVLGLSSSHDLVLVSLDQADQSGLSVVHALRQGGRRCPIVIMTRHDEEDVLVGALDAGADDYIVRPVSDGVLRARVRAALRRRAVATRDDDVVVCGNITLTRSTRRVRVAELEPGLTTREFTLLQFMLERADEVVSRTELLEGVWKMRCDTTTNVVDATMCRLRAKLRDAGANSAPRTVRGRGYLLTVPAACEY